LLKGAGTIQFGDLLYENQRGVEFQAALKNKERKAEMPGKVSVTSRGQE